MRVRWISRDFYGRPIELPVNASNVGLAVRQEPSDPTLIRVKWGDGYWSWVSTRNLIFRVPSGRRVVTDAAYN
jgi:hypothetical protein